MTLLETSITSVILLFGLVAVGALFSYSHGTTVTNQQRTAASALLQDKIEQFKSGPLGEIVPGVDYVTVGSATYERVWQATGGLTRSITVVVYVERAGLTRQRLELIRAATSMSSGF